MACRRFSISLDVLNDDQTAICDDCTATVVAGACIVGLCADYDVTRTNELISIPSSCRVSAATHRYVRGYTPSYCYYCSTIANYHDSLSVRSERFETAT